MAKSKDKDAPVEKTSIEKIKEYVDHKYGEQIICSSNELFDKPKQVIPVSLALDVGLSGGVPEGSVVLISGPPKFGKAQPLDSLIYTVDGPKKMGDIEIGDKVCTPDGGVATVDGIYPQGEIDIYRIYFRKGDYVDATLDHLWLAKAEHYKSWSILSTADLISKELVKYDRPIWRIPLLTGCYFEPRKVDIPPYMLGVLIADGSLTKGARFTKKNDQAIISRIISELIDGYEVKRVSDTITYSITRGRTGGGSNYYIDSLRELGLYGLKSKDKFIPDIYKYNSISVRTELLRGLLDTDGSVTTDRGSVEYSTASIRLANDIKELVQSLGGMCKIVSRFTKCNNKLFKSYRCHCRFNNSSDFFWLDRKRKRCKIRTKKPLTRGIEKIERIGKKTAQCIKISCPKGLYLTDNFVVTHNTTLALTFAANCQKPKYGNRTIYYFNIEGRLKKNLNLDGIEGLEYENTDKFKIIGTNKDHILTQEDTLDIVEKIIKEHENAVLILDAVSALVPRKTVEEGIEHENRSKHYQTLARLLDEVGPLISRMNIIVIGIAHLYANVGGYGRPFIEKVSNRFAYQMDVKLRATKSEDFRDKEGERPVGKKTKWVCDCSSLGPPGLEVESVLRYGKGLDSVQELIYLASAFGLIKENKGWYTFPGQDKKIRNNEVYELFRTTEGLFETFKKDIFELMGIKYEG